MQGERSILYTSRSRPASPFPAPVTAGARSKDTPLLVLPPAGTGTAHRHGWGGTGWPRMGTPQLPAGAGLSPAAWHSGSGGEFWLPQCHAVPMGMTQSRRNVSGEPRHQPLSLLQLHLGTS